MAKNPKFLNPYEEGGLKVKKKSLLVVIAILSVLLVGVGSAYAVIGVNDEVPGQDLVIPFVCGRTDLDSTNSLNTLYAIAEVKGGGPVGTNWVSTDRLLYNSRSITTIDFPTPFTAHDLLSFDCHTDFYGNGTTIPGQSVATLNDYTITVNGREYLAGYTVLRQNSANDGFCTGGTITTQVISCTANSDCYAEGGITATCDKSPQDRFIGWNYLVDLEKGFASGFDSISEEGGAGPNLGEVAGSAPVTAATLYPRIYIHNALAETWNWWIILAGRNELNCGGVTPFPGRRLTGFICTIDEICNSFSIPIPDELNIVDLLTQVPQVSTIPGYPKSGFAIANVTETVSISGATFTLTGTTNTGLCGNIFPAYSIYGYSYQRAQSDTPHGGFNGSWDVVHPMHRDYCSGDASGLPWVTGPECAL